MLDGCFLYKLKEEIMQKAGLARVDKIHQPGPHELVLHLRGKGTFRLLVSVRPGSARMAFTESPPENPGTPPMFCQLLRKHLAGARLCAITGYGFDRVAVMEFSGQNELFLPTAPRLIIELIGQQANVILTDENLRIIDALRRTDLESARMIMPGAMYIPPTPRPRLSPDTNSATLAQAMLDSGKPTLFDAVMDTIDGLSPATARELERLGGDMDSATVESVTAAVESLQAALNSDGGAYMILGSNDEPKDFILLKPGHENCRYFESLSGCLEHFYGERDAQARRRHKSDSLRRDTARLIARVNNRINAQKADLERTKQREQLRINGELIKANLHLIERGAESCRLPNYYEPDMAEIDIKLNPALSPAGNAARYFKQYKKLSTAASMLNDFIEAGQKEAAYLESVAYSIEAAETDGALLEIERELQAGGYKTVRGGLGKNARKAPKIKPADPIGFTSPDGIEILVGRNNIQNEQLTFGIADKFDIWLHAKNIPGSHVIIRSGATYGSEFPPDETLLMAAALAGKFSSAGQSGIEIDYAFVKHVRKQAGAGPGMVLYENFHTVIAR